jgi:hypothetical protein
MGSARRLEVRIGTLALDVPVDRPGELAGAVEQELAREFAPPGGPPLDHDEFADDVGAAVAEVVRRELCR